jgi:hypothetical protein
VLAGANIMCPGLTSAGGDLDAEVAADSPVVSPLRSWFGLAWVVFGSSVDWRSSCTRCAWQEFGCELSRVGCGGGGGLRRQ